MARASGVNQLWDFIHLRTGGLVIFRIESYTSPSISQAPSLVIGHYRIGLRTCSGARHARAMRPSASEAASLGASCGRRLCSRERRTYLGDPPVFVNNLSGRVVAALSLWLARRERASSAAPDAAAGTLRAPFFRTSI